MACRYGNALQTRDEGRTNKSHENVGSFVFNARGGFPFTQGTPNCLVLHNFYVLPLKKIQDNASNVNLIFQAVELASF